VRHAIAAVAGCVLVVLGTFGLFRGRVLPSGLTILMGCLGIAGALYHRERPAHADAPPERRVLLTMSLTWLAIGAVTLVVGFASGGVLLPICVLGFALSMYLCIGFGVAALRV
jgi:hypothetical protein